jgi:phosphohistidine phosphatase
MAATRHLYLLRHAKSSWDNTALEDRARPLAPRGWKATQLIGAHLRSEGIEPELVLCSSSRRTRETLEGVEPGGQVLIEDDLYSAGPGEVLARLHAIDDGIGSVMVIGHNPTLQKLALRLVGRRADDGEGSPLAEIKRKFPTGALATIEFEGPWRELSEGRGELSAFVRPKSLG